MNVKKLSKFIGVIFIVLILGGVIIGLFSSFKTYELRRQAEQTQETAKPTQKAAEPTQENK